MNVIASRSVGAARFGTWLLMTAVVMLFAGFASAYTVLHGSAGWRTIQIPALLWVNTGILLLSSGTLEWSRLRRSRWGFHAVRAPLFLTLVLGIVFLAGQVMAWLELREAGIHLATGAAAAFFYILTGAHGLHLAGGIGALGYALVVPSRETLQAAAMYWHFMDALWLVLLFLIAA